MKRSYLLFLGILALAAYPAAAQVVLYQQNFDSLASASTAATPGSYVAVGDIGGSGWQIQGGTDSTGSVGLTAGINNNGVGGSQALFGTWDLSTGAIYTWNQYSYYGVGGAGAGATLADIQISLDILVSGTDGSSTTPVTVSALQSSGNNSLSYTPTLVEGQYTHVAFNLSQATASGGAFDPTAAFWFRLSHGNGGFGFDSGNTVQIDNVMITAVPEPATAALLGLGALGLVWLRRRS